VDARLKPVSDQPFDLPGRQPGERLPPTLSGLGCPDRHVRSTNHAHEELKVGAVSERSQPKSQDIPLAGFLSSEVSQLETWHGVLPNSPALVANNDQDGTTAIIATATGDRQRARLHLATRRS